MDIFFYYNQSDDRQINKVLDGETKFEGYLRDDCGIMNPVIRIQNPAVLRYNYCYIPDFQRYYSVSSITAVSDILYDVYLNVDVLMSFRNHILQLSAIVDKQTDVDNGDEYIDDSSLVTDNLMFTRVYNFTAGFLDSPEYILITAG